jgi:hypothetical protein
MMVFVVSVNDDGGDDIMTKNLQKIVKNNDTEDNSLDDLEEYLEHLSRTTPTTMPEWMN